MPLERILDATVPCVSDAVSIGILIHDDFPGVGAFVAGGVDHGEAHGMNPRIIEGSRDLRSPLNEAVLPCPDIDLDRVPAWVDRLVCPQSEIPSTHSTGREDNDPCDRRADVDLYRRPVVREPCGMREVRLSARPLDEEEPLGSETAREDQFPFIGAHNLQQTAEAQGC